MKEDGGGNRKKVEMWEDRGDVRMWGGSTERGRARGQTTGSEYQAKAQHIFPELVNAYTQILLVLLKAKFCVHTSQDA